MVAVFCLSSVSAQRWGAGIRVGSGVQAVGQYVLTKKNYVEARLGVSMLGRTNFGITGLYNWNIRTMNWTKKGVWFFDLGAGANLGFGRKHFHIGPQGMARLGYEFERTPIELGIDWSPVVAFLSEDDYRGLYGSGLINFGLSCVYRF